MASREEIEKIKLRIKNEVEDIFLHVQEPRYNFSVEDSINTLFDLMNYRIDDKTIDAVGKVLINAFIYFEKEHKTEDLVKALAGQCEQFAKFILGMINPPEYYYIKDQGFAAVLKKLRLATNKVLSAKSLQELKGQPRFAEHIGRIYLTRNDVHHNSVVYTMKEMGDIFQSLCVFYIFIVAEYREKLEEILQEKRKNFQELTHPKQAKAYPSHFPFKRNTYFKGRDDDLVSLDRLLTKASQQIVSVHGMGGIGKTQLVVEYIYRRGSRYSGVFWIDASDSYINEFVWLASQHLRLTVEPSGNFQEDRRNLLRKLHSFFEEYHDILLIIDNIKDPLDLNCTGISGFAPLAFKCRILLTTTSRVLPPGIEGFKIGVLSKDAAYQLLTNMRHLDTEAEQAARDLCEILGRLPLAIEMVRAYLAKYPHVSFDDYKQEMLEYGLLLIDEMGLKTGELYHDAAVGATLKKQYEMIKDNRDACRVFQLAGQLSKGSPISKSRLKLMTGLLESKSKLRDPLMKAFQTLYEFSLVEELTDDLIRLHPLVSEFAFRLITDEEREQFLYHATCHLYKAYNNFEIMKKEYQFRGLGFLEDIDIILRFVLKQNPEEIRCLCERLFKLGDILIFGEYLYRAYKCYEKAHQIIILLLDYYGNLEPNLQTQAKSLKKLGDSLIYHGKYEKALQCYKKGSEILENLLRCSPKKKEFLQDKADNLEKMVEIFESQCRFEEACKLSKESLRYRIKLAVIENRSLATSIAVADNLQRLGKIFEEQGKLIKANQLYNASLKIATNLKTFSLHEDINYLRLIGMIQDNLGGSSRKQGKLAEAYQHYVQSLEIRKKLTERTGESIESLRNEAISQERLGEILEDLGRWENASESYQKSFELRKKIVEITNDSLENLKRESENAIALTWMQQEVQNMVKNFTQEELIKSNDWNIKNMRDLGLSLDNLGHIYQVQGQLANAVDAFRKSFQIREGLVSRTDRSIQSLRDLSLSWNRLGDVYQAQGQLANAADAFRNSFLIAEELVSRTDRSIQSLHDLSLSWNRLGDVYQAQGQLANAADAFRNSFLIAEGLVSRTDRSIQSLRDLSLSWNKLGDVYQAQGQLANVADAFRNSFQIQEELVSRTDRSIQSLRDLSVSWSKLGDVYQAQGQLPNAADAFRNSFQIDEELVSRTDRSIESLRDLAVSWNRLGDVYQVQGQLANAADAFRNSYQIAEELVSRTDRSLQSLRDLSICWNKLGDIYQAQGKLQNATDAFQNSFRLVEELVERTDRSIQRLRDLSINWNKLGDIYQAQGQLQSATDAFQNSFRIAEELVARTDRSNQSLRDLSISRTKLGNISYANKQPQKGRQQYGESLALNSEIVKNSADVLQVLRDALNHASHCRLHGEYRLALDFLELARQCWQRQYVQASESERLLLSQSAMDYSRQLTQVVREGCLVGFFGAEQWIQMICSLEDMRTRHIVELIGLREAQPDFSALERESGNDDYYADKLARGRSSFEKFQQMQQQFEQNIAQLRRYEIGLQNLLITRSKLCESKSPQAQQLLQSSEQEYRQLQQQVGSRQRHHHELQKKLQIAADQVRIAAPAFLPECGEMKLSEIVALADVNQALVTFSITPEGTVVFVLTNNTHKLEENVSFFVIERFTSNELQSLVVRRNEHDEKRGWLEALQTGKHVQTELQCLVARLYSELFAPVERSLRQRRIESIVFVPAELAICPLHLIKIENQIDDGVEPVYLQDRYRISYAPSFRLLELSRKRRGRKLDQVQIVANPLGDTIFSAIEADEISALLRASGKTIHYVQRRKATLETVLTLLSYQGGFHFAGHGQFNFLNPLHSCLLLASDDGQPPKSGTQSGDNLLVLARTKFAPLTLAQILETVNLSGNAQFVLSACEVGLVDFAHINEVISFPTALLCGGAPAVVAGMWRVSDLSTCILMAEYYRQLLAGADKITALRQAQQRVRAMGNNELCQRLDAWKTRAEDTGNTDLAKALTTELRILRINDEERPFADPYYWGAFYLSGETGPVV